MNKALIKSILLLKGWAEIEKFLTDKFNNIKIDDKKDIDEIGKQYLAKQMAMTVLQNTLALMNRIKNEEIKKEIKY